MKAFSKAIFVLVFLGVFCSFQVQSQRKYEREMRIHKSEVPPAALQYISGIQLNTRMKWFKEIGLNEITYEAKTIYHRERFSIEFTNKGELIDVEIEIKEKDIPQPAHNKMLQYLDSLYVNFHVDKIQIQFSGNKHILASCIKQWRMLCRCVHRQYELVVNTQVDGNFQLFNYIFSDTGEFVESAHIVFKRIDTLEF